MQLPRMSRILSSAIYFVRFSRLSAKRISGLLAPTSWVFGKTSPPNELPLLKLTFSHLKMDGWNTIVSFWGPAYFQGLLLLVSGRVFQPTHQLFSNELYWTIFGHLQTSSNNIEYRMGFSVFPNYLRTMFQGDFAFSASVFISKSILDSAWKWEVQYTLCPRQRYVDRVCPGKQERLKNWKTAQTIGKADGSNQWHSLSIEQWSNK